MLIELVVLAVGYGPGDVRRVVSFNTAACANPTSINTEGLCFVARGENIPSTFCRQWDDQCDQTNQSVVSALTFEHDGLCTTYRWTWSCAYDQREVCGSFWCDQVSTCVNDTNCECPEGMHGDPKWTRCYCPPNFIQNGSSCEAIPDVVNTTLVQRVEVQKGPSAAFTAFIAVFMLIFCISGVFIGKWYCVPSTVVPVNHIENGMYESAGGGA